MSENELPPPGDPGKNLSRRRFLYLAGAGGLVLAVASAGGPTGDDDATGDVVLAAAATRSLHLRRREDSLNLRVDLFNADVVQTSGGAELRKVTTGSAFLVVHFPPQAVLERMLTDPLRLTDIPLATRVAGRSRLAFDITAALPMAVTVDALLAWTGFVPSLAPTATRTQTASALVAPTDTQTALELPWRILLSPNENEGWQHSAAPVTRNGWTELWHTRLGAKTGSGAVDDHATGRTVRAIWLSDPQMATWVQNPTSVPGTEDIAHVLTPRQRFSIVRLSADPTLRTSLDPALPKPIDVTELTLSSLGATFDAEGRWTYPPTGGLGLKGWQHRATLGRDHLVRTEDAGFLFPYGHRASLVNLAERRFGRRPNPDGTPGPWYAYVHRSQHIVVQQPVRAYAGDDTMPHAGRELPFTAIRVVTRTTPPLKDPRSDFVTGSTTTVRSFVPRAAAAPDTPVTFHLRGTDHDGVEVDFSAAVVFVPESTVTDTNATRLLTDLRNAYNTGNSPDPAAGAVRTAETGGRTIALAQRGPYPVGSTAATTDQLVFNSVAANGSMSTLVAAGRAPFVPSLELAALRLPDVAALTGTATATTSFVYAAAYLDGGIDHAGNRGAVYLATHPAIPVPPALEFPAASTGVATPNGGIRGRSAKNGTITGDVTQAATEYYDPAKVFADPTKAKVLGGLAIKDLLSTPLEGEQNALVVPKLGHHFREDVGVHEWTLLWTPPLQEGPKQLPVFEPLSTAPNAKTLKVHAVYTDPVQDGVESTYRVDGELRDFALNLFGKKSWQVISVKFDYFRFKHTGGAKPTVDCRIREVSFHNAFEFVEELAELCSFLGGKVEITAGTSGIQAGLRFGLPTVSLGIFELKELAVAASVAIPFDGSSVRVVFDLNTRDRPFNLRISWFAGGGYAGIALGADGLERLDVGFTFGAAFALDVGIASGGVEAVGGISYLLEKVKVVENGAEVVRSQAGLTAFLRLRGALDFLGIVSVSIEFYLGLTYQKKTDGSSALVGEASVSVSIETWFYSETFTVRTRRELSKTSAPAAGRAAGGDRAALAAAPAVPAHPFGAAFTQQDWASYCAAFAPVGA